MTRSPALLHVVQARAGSRRLPGKVLSPLGAWPLLAYTVRRAQAAGGGDVVVATTTRQEDEAVAVLAAHLGVGVLRGPSEDVLARFALVAQWRPDVRWVARWTADNPFADDQSPGRMLTAIPPAADYAVEEGLPVGAAVEIMSRRVLLEAHEHAVTPYDREHVTPWIKRLDPSRLFRPQAPVGLRAANVRLTVDTRADLQAMRQIVSALTGAGHDARSAPLCDVLACARTVAIEDVA